ncbi:hypothetical protein GCM10023261_13460 [Bartonella jaculi]|uniref:Uncharacterized protein n=1 Tax=Bartonella jaculi TaxID=686226 RepID=A0ABP9N7J8_9HYPH
MSCDTSVARAFDVAKITVLIKIIFFNIKFPLYAFTMIDFKVLASMQIV